MPGVGSLFSSPRFQGSLDWYVAGGARLTVKRIFKLFNYMLTMQDTQLCAAGVSLQQCFNTAFIPLTLAIRERALSFPLTLGCKNSR